MFVRSVPNIWVAISNRVSAKGSPRITFHPLGAPLRVIAIVLNITTGPTAFYERAPQPHYYVNMSIYWWVCVYMCLLHPHIYSVLLDAIWWWDEIRDSKYLVIRLLNFQLATTPPYAFKNVITQTSFISARSGPSAHYLTTVFVCVCGGDYML